MKYLYIQSNIKGHRYIKYYKIMNDTKKISVELLLEYLKHKDSIKKNCFIEW